MDIGKVGESIGDPNGLPERPGWPRITILREKYPSAGYQVNPTAKSDIVNHNFTISVLNRGPRLSQQSFTEGIGCQSGSNFPKEKAVVATSICQGNSNMKMSG